MSVLSTMIAIKSAEEKEWRELYEYIVGLEKDDKEWRKKYENAVADYEEQKSENEMLKKAVKENVIATCNTCEDYGICPHSYREYDLDNVVRDLESWLIEWRDMIDCPDFYEEGIIDCTNDTLNKLQELKDREK